MPVDSIYNLARIACSSCSGTASDLLSTGRPDGMSDALAAAAVTSSDKDSIALLTDLRLKILETNSAISSLTDEVYDKWTSAFNSRSDVFERLKAYVTKHLSVEVSEPTSLTEFEKKLVHILLQASNFVYFLEAEHTQVAYGEKAATLFDVKGRLLQVVCAARQLLAQFSDYDIQGFVGENVHYSLQLQSGFHSGIRRAVCAVALKQMTTSLSTIDLNE